jgi:hypothetical protein
MRSRVSLLLLVPLILASSGCVTVTARKAGGELDTSEPTYSKGQTHYAGFGAAHHDAKAACGGKPIEQIQYKTGFGIWIFDFSKARIWCGK